MSYCFNPACQNPHQADDVRVCLGCGANLLLADRYRAIKLLGSGGFGSTFLAIDEYKPSQPLCAIKLLLPEQQSPIASSKERFYQEAVQLEQLGVHDRIPHLLAYFTQHDRHYLVQEFIDGQNLAQELESQGAFSEVKIRHLLEELLPVLEFIHDRQVIHRDIKPENIIRRNTRSGELVLVNFGATKVTPPGKKTGSAAYRAPEQLLGKAVAASDIYSLGVTCIHLLTSIPALDLYDSTEGPWVWRDFLRTPITRSLGQILDKMLCTALKSRYPSASSILADLNPTVPSTAIPLPPLIAPSPQPLPPLFLDRKVPKPQPQNPKVVSRHPEKRKAPKIAQALQKSLTKYRINVKVTWGIKTVTVVLQREKGRQINYAYLGKEIVKTIGENELPASVETIKVFGQVQGVTEWKHYYQVKPEKQLFKSARVKLAEDRTKRFWLTRLQDRKFWLDVLTFAMLSFVLNFRIVLLHPLVATMAAGGFIVVKNRMGRDRNFQEKKLVKSVMLGCIILGLVHVNWSIEGGFGILLACLLMGLPLFYVRS